MAIALPSKLIADLAKAFGLPKTPRSLELRVAKDEIVTIKCEYFPEDLDGKALEPIFAEYQLVAKQPEWVGVDPGDHRGDMTAIFERPVGSKIPPPPPPPPLSRMIREDVRPDHFCPKCHSSMARKWYIFGRRKCVHPKCGYVDGSELPEPTRPAPPMPTVKPARAPDLNGRDGNGYQPLHERHSHMPNVNPPPTYAMPPAPPAPPQPHGYHGAHVEPPQPWPR